MMEEYEVFDEYLRKSKSIREYCEQNEKLLFESIRLVDATTDCKIKYLSSVGCEIDKVISYIEELKTKSKIPLSFREII